MSRQERGQLQTSLLGGNPLLSLLAPRLKPIATQWFYGGPGVVEVDGDNDVEHGQTSVLVTGHDFGDTQGTGLVRIGDGPDFGTANLVAQTVTAWADGAIEITVSLGAQDPGPKWLYVTTGAGETSVGRPIWVHRGTAFTLHPSANIGAGATDATTARLTAPAGTFSAGVRSDDTNPLPVEAFAADGYTEWELSVVATTRAVPGEDYEFRVVGLLDDGTVVPLAAYTVLATWSVAAGAGATNAPAGSGPTAVTAQPATAIAGPRPTPGPVSTTAGPAAAQASASATSATTATVAPSASATVRPTATTATTATTAPPATVTARPATGSAPTAVTAPTPSVTVLAQAGVATIGAVAGNATANTSSSTTATAGVAAVGVTAPAPAGQLRPAATSAPVGSTAQFDPGTITVLQLVADNPITVAVSAANATVSTSATTNAPAAGAPVILTAGGATGQGRPTPTAAPVSVTALAPSATVRAQAGVAAIAVTAPPPTGTVGASATTAPVIDTAPPVAVVVRAQPAAAPISAAAGNAIATTSGQTLANASGASVGVSGQPVTGLIRPSAGAGTVATTAQGPTVRVGLRPTPATVIALALAAGVTGPADIFTGGLNVLLQIQTLTRVRPAASTDAYGNNVLSYGVAAARTTFEGWLQQDARAESRPDGRGPNEQRWLLMCNLADLDTDDRIEWPTGHPAGPLVFAVEGPPEPAYRPPAAGAGGFHHTEATLRLLEG